MCSETSSPRLSFSGDVLLLPLEEEPHNTNTNTNTNNRRDTSLLEMSCESDFSFSFTSGFSSQESSSADELFSHGIILPTQPLNPLKSLPPLPSFPDKKPKEIISDHHHHQHHDHHDHYHQIKPQAKSFWGSFKRSNSLNCENKKSGLLCSLPLLSRSNSTGSVPNQKRNGFKNTSSMSSSSQKQPLISMARSSSLSSSSSSSSSTSSSNSHPMLQKPPLKKSYGGGGGFYGNGVRIIPVINVPPPYISKGTAKLFGLGSFLHHGKDKKPTKK